MGRGFRILSDRSGTVENHSPRSSNSGIKLSQAALPSCRKLLFNADSLRKAQHPVIFSGVTVRLSASTSATCGRGVY